MTAASKTEAQLEWACRQIEALLNRVSRLENPAFWAEEDARQKDIEDRTGLCTVREAVATMLEYKSDEMEMYFSTAGKRVNVELRITKVEDA